MAIARDIPIETPRRGGFRGRLLLYFMGPVLLLGVGAFVLLEFLYADAGAELALSSSLARGILLGMVLLGLSLAAALALQTGDRLTEPVARLLRAIDAGQVHLLSQLPDPEADWELSLLCDRVRVLLGQNLSGAKAVEELDALRREVEAVLDRADAGDLGPEEESAHPLTQRLIEYFRSHQERCQEAAAGIHRLQGVVEQDWREETLAVEDIVRRAERAFLQQTQLAVELERLERLVGQGLGGGRLGSEVPALLKDLRLGIERWRHELAPGGSGVGRMRQWEAWVDESLTMLEEAFTKATRGGGDAQERMAAGLEKVAAVVAESNQEVSALSRDIVHLQRAWNRLGERLRTLMVRVEEARDDTFGGSPSEERDADV